MLKDIIFSGKKGTVLPKKNGSLRKLYFMVQQILKVVGQKSCRTGMSDIQGFN